MVDRRGPVTIRPMLFSRHDGTLARDVPHYRRIMPFIMRGKNESAAYFDQELDLERTEAFVSEWNKRSTARISIFHVYVWALVQTLAARPRLNRFVAGSRIYQRDGIWVSYSAKKAFNDDAPVVVLKRKLEPGRPFAEIVDALDASVREGRSDKKSHVDKELGILLRLPGLLLGLLVAFQRLLDAWNLLPASLIRPDPLYSSIFVANLGSLKLDAVHHHLYEYGNIPIFACIGRKRRAVDVDASGAIVTKLVCSVKYTYDERVEDGLYCTAALDHLRKIVEDPEAAGIQLPPAADETDAKPESGRPSHVNAREESRAAS